MPERIEKERGADRRNYRRSGLLLLFVAIFLLDAFPGFYFQSVVPHAMAAFAVWGIYFLGMKLALYLIDRFLSSKLAPVVVEIALTGCLGYLLYDTLNATSSLGCEEGFWLYGIAGVGTILLWLFAFGMEARRRSLLAAILGAASLGVVLIAAFSPGIASRGDVAPAIREIPETYGVERIRYGPGEKYDFGTESYARYAREPKRQKAIRRHLFGYDLSRVPYRGTMYLPEGAEKVPLLVFTHGNHNMLEDNAGGYDALGRYLAARGIAFVSVEGSHFNAYLNRSLTGENDARAMSLLNHAEKLLSDPRLSGRFDEDRLYLGGHSRGGEAAAIAANFTALSRNPDTAEDTPSLPIAGVIAVAPTDGQYRPADHSVELDVPYLLIQGAYDQDVSSMEGMDQYARARGKKYQVLIHYANHSGFNAHWGRFDRSGLSGLTLRTADIMEGKDQRAFLNVLAYALIRDEAIFDTLESYLPQTGFSFTSERPGTILADFEEDADLLTASLEGASFEDLHTEEIFEPAGRGGKNHAAKVREKLVLATPRFFEGDFAVDISPKEKKTHLQIILEDASKERVEMPYTFSEDHPPFQTMLLKWQQLAEKPEDKRSFQTLRISPEEARRQNLAFRWEEIRRVEIRSDREIEIDNLRIESN